jgi:AraC family transcriptional regulator
MDMSYFSSMRLADYGGIDKMPPHSHDHDVICLPLGGSYFERTRGRETRHQLGDILFCPAGEKHSQLFPAGRVVKLLITPTAVASDHLSRHVALAEAPFRRARPLEALGVRLAREIGRPDDQSPLIAEGLGLEIIGLFSRATDDEMGTSPWLRAARDFVRSHSGGTLRLADVAAHVGRDAARLAAAYRRAFGCTIGEDARAFRLRRAASLLAATRDPIAGIAAECGYFDQAHFTRAFQKSYGVAPGAYRTAFH